MRVQHNIAAMNSYRNYSNNTKTINKNLEKLSSGYKINRAGDDAAGLAISEKMRAQITGIAGAQKNAKDGISLVQTAEGALTEVHSMLNRMYELAEESANGTFEGLDREQLQKEVDQLRTEINRIADSSNFNGIKLLDGSLSSTGGTGVSGKAITADLSKVAVDVRASVEDVEASKGRYQTKSLLMGDAATTTSIAGIKAGDQLELSINYTDEAGKEHTLTQNIILKSVVSTSTVCKIILDDGTEEGIELKSVPQAAAASDLTAAEISKLAAEALKNDSTFSNLFKIDGTVAAGALDFTAMTAGTNGAVVNDVTLTFKTKVDMDANKSTNYTYFQSKITVATQALDANKSYDFTKQYVWDNTGKATMGDTLAKEKLEDAIFEINGKKFVFYDATLNDEDKAKLAAAGVDHFIQAAVAGATASDVEEMAYHIQKETGMKVRQGTNTSGTWADTSTGTKLMFEALGSSVVKGKGGLTLQIGDTGDTFNQMNVSIKDIHVKALGISTMDISDQANAKTAMDDLKSAINYVSDIRGTLGATQNRLEHTMNNLSVMQENMQDAESSIRDTDVADEMMKYTKNSILVQSAQAMLAQANQQPQGVLQLLQ